MKTKYIVVKAENKHEARFSSLPIGRKNVEIGSPKVTS
jgi:hypothetical protein